MTVGEVEQRQKAALQEPGGDTPATAAAHTTGGDVPGRRLNIRPEGLVFVAAGGAGMGGS